MKATSDAARSGCLLMTFAFLLGGCAAGQEFVDSTAQKVQSMLGDPEPLYRSLTDADVDLANAALDRALERNLSGTAASWSNRASGNAGSVTPLRTFKSNDGGYCREYREVIRVGNDSEAYVDTACREASGIWRPVAS